jgi:hypothetical protein
MLLFPAFQYLQDIVFKEFAYRDLVFCNLHDLVAEGFDPGPGYDK